MYHHDFNEKIGFWYVIALAGQSNGMAYGEGIPLPDTLDKPESRVKQLARRKTITPGGKECKFNEIIPADRSPTGRNVIRTTRARKCCQRSWLT